ncbi:hypothetical protein ABFS83_11G100900 [Erythranthe nasuta]
MGTDELQPGTKPEFRRFLTAAEYFLSVRQFDDCRTYAVRARDSDPNHPAPTQILSIASVLSAPNISSTRPDYYSVFNLPHFEPDSARIMSAFKTLAPILNPKDNPYPLSPEAFAAVLSAWSVLSIPANKAIFDDELRRSLAAASAAGGGGGGTFWTVCPYCYYVYEYDKAFQDCSLRCANEGCRRVLHAAAIAEPPPPEVVEKGGYLCPGFVPLAVRNEEIVGEKLWGPFASKVFDNGSSCDGGGFVVDISDDDETACAEEDAENDFDKIGFQDHCSSGKRKQVESKEDGYNLDGDGEKTESKGIIGNDRVCMESGEKGMGKRRKKSVPWNSKKLMGRGFRIESNQARFFVNGERHHNMNVDEVFFGNNVGSSSGVEFFERGDDDDVFVGLNLDF